MLPAHSDQVRHLAEAIELSATMKEEVACLALHLGETPDAILTEALSELRSLYDVICHAPDHITTECCSQSVDIGNEELPIPC